MTTDPRVLLVTGTSSGIGLATAVAAARRGWTTVATVRDPDRADDLRAAAHHAGVTLDVRRLDVTEVEAIGDTVAGVVADHGRLDAVVSNAGAGLVGTVEGIGLDGFRRALDVNFFSLVALAEAALPHLRAAHGRLVAVTSVGGVVGQPFNEAYCAAKFAAEGFLESLHPVAAALGVGVSVIEPGAVATQFAASAMAAMSGGQGAALTPGGAASTVSSASATTPQDDPYATLLAAYLARTRDAFAAAQDPAEVAAIVADLLDDGAPAFRVQTSPTAHGFVALKLADLDGSRVTGLTQGWITA